MKILMFPFSYKAQNKCLDNDENFLQDILPVLLLFKLFTYLAFQETAGLQMAIVAFLLAHLEGFIPPGFVFLCLTSLRLNLAYIKYH